jgi:2-polyprenyl-3-methyl-5-hydroxy-6-metoxy-1,4-benzoquinol methylase
MESLSTNDSLVIELSPAEEVDMADEWYEFATQDHFWIQWRFRKIWSSSVVRSYPASRWLDVGCGHGLVIRQFEASGDYVIDGCDLNRTALRRVGKVRGDIYVYNVFDANPLMVGRYSGILLLDVIEHIDDEGAFLEASLRHMQPGGLVVINVPALEFLFSRYDDVAGHKRRYNKLMLRTLMESHGIEPLEISYWGMLLLPLALIRKLVLTFVSRRNIIRRGFRPPARMINSFFKVLMKVELLIFRRPPLGTSILAVGRKR